MRIHTAVYIEDADIFYIVGTVIRHEKPRIVLS